MATYDFAPAPAPAPAPVPVIDPNALLRADPMAWLRRLGQSCDAFIAVYEADRRQVVFVITLAWNELQRRLTGATPMVGGASEYWQPTPEGGVMLRQPDPSFPERMADVLYQHCLLMTGRGAAWAASPPALSEQRAVTAKPAVVAKGAQLSKPTGQLPSTDSSSNGLVGAVLGFVFGFIAGSARR